MPSSRQVGRISASISRVQREYSVCRAAIGWTLAARRRVLGGGFAHAEISDFALFDEIGHGADGFFDRRLGIDAVLVVEIDDIDCRGV